MNNPGVETFTVERILESIGHERMEASLMLLSLPAMLPVRAPRGLTTMSTGVIGCQLACGKKRVQLPKFIMRKTVSRKSLAVAIHAILPVLEAAERVVRPRWSWVTHPIARRAIGLFVFLLAVAIAYPLVGFDALHALSVFVMSLGMAEGDGLAVMLGMVAGVASLAIVAASGWSPRALRARLGNALRKMARRLGLTKLGRLLERHGYVRLARLFTFEWADLLMRWEPEKGQAVRAQAAARAARPPRPPYFVTARRSAPSGARAKSRPAPRSAAPAVGLQPRRRAAAASAAARTPQPALKRLACA